MIALLDPTIYGSSVGFTGLAGLLMIYLFVRGLIFQGSLLLFLKNSAFALRRRVYRIPFGKNQLKSELFAGLRTISIDGLFFAALVKYGPQLPFNQSVLLSFAVSFVWFEIWFYTSHRLFHTKALYFLHDQHHVARVTSPMTALSFSVLERVILLVGGLGGLMLLSYILPVSALGLALYLLVNYALNIFGHSNFEIIPPAILNSPLGRFLNTPTYHALHHARYKGHYGLFTPYLDRLFNSRFADYELVHRRAYNENGLTHLAERMS